jgi:arylsulfatase A-like enzyme
MHDANGIAVLAGPGVSHIPERQVVKLVDVAPTLMALADISVPQGLDGRPFIERNRLSPIRRSL